MLIVKLLTVTGVLTVTAVAIITLSIAAGTPAGDQVMVLQGPAVTEVFVT